ncbi:hypothetical protein MUN78_09115 [Leucobacter allii]|uniref:Uncharacterized protein n=1 Tax=Leucobacter allii TaxID=2932247 RepID=A0ABY4FGR6_9MICO|nr:hypothetical protein [Leucobacter allii]UOQ55868.1 hypothetical protein MUN78_09115 [Leucobacter allii]
MNESDDVPQSLAFIAAALVLACLLAVVAVFGVSVLGGGVTGLLPEDGGAPAGDPGATTVVVEG